MSRGAVQLLDIDPSWRRCDHSGCGNAGEYRAPRSRDARHSYYWFCLDHVRAYNRAWDFFAGMSQRDIEAYQQSVATWHRPTWRMGLWPHGGYRNEDAFTPFGEGGAAARPAAPQVLAEERRALATLDLAPGVTLADIKSRYKVLVKRYHPDANGGSRESEEQLKLINQAHTFLLSCGRY